MCFSKDIVGLFGLHKQVEWCHFEPMLSNVGHSQGRKGLGNGPILDHKWIKNGSKPWFSKNDPSPVVAPKRMNTAHFEPLLSRSHPLSSSPHLSLKSPRQCSFPHQLSPNIQSRLGVGVGFGLGTGSGLGRPRVGLGFFSRHVTTVTTDSHLVVWGATPHFIFSSQLGTVLRGA